MFIILATDSCIVRPLSRGGEGLVDGLKEFCSGMRIPRVGRSVWEKGGVGEGERFTFVYRTCPLTLASCR